ncbi:MAG: class I SAM-dependent methyltransferase [Dehalococcoidia bacterium]
MPTWDELYADETVAPADPHPWVVHSLDALRAAGVRRVLDLGCGGGRHLVLLGQRSIEAWGTDASPRGLRQSRRRLAAAAIPARLALADMRTVPFADDAFDAVIAIHVLYHGGRADVQQGLDEVERALRPGGLFVGTFLSDRSWKYGEGKRLEDGTFIQVRGPEAGVPHHYCDEQSVRELLDRFAIEQLHLDEYIDDAGDRHSHWEVIARASFSEEHVLH